VPSGRHEQLKVIQAIKDHLRTEGISLFEMTVHYLNRNIPFLRLKEASLVVAPFRGAIDFPL
jgi:hypothetical protein